MTRRETSMADSSKDAPDGSDEATTERHTGSTLRLDASGLAWGARARLLRALTIAVDALAIVGSVYGASLLRRGARAIEDGLATPFEAFTGGTTFVVVLTLVFLYVFETYELQLRLPRWFLVARVGGAVILAAVVSAFIFYLAPWWKLFRSVFALAFALAFPALCVGRLIVMRLALPRIPAHRAIRFADGETSEGIAVDFSAHPFAPIRVVDELRFEPSQGRAPDLVAACRERVAGTILCDFHEPLSPPLVAELIRCKAAGVRVVDQVALYREMTGRFPIRRIDPTRLVFGRPFSLRSSRSAQTLQRAMDVSLSVLGLVVAAPLCLIVAALIAATMGRPVIFAQARVGRDGRIFTLYKFRTMVADAEREGPQWATEGDARVTPLGRFLRRTRLDELPQLWNVVRGDMSLIGPRPEQPYFVERLRETIPFYDLRHVVKPGLTGWAQVNRGYGSSELDAEEKLEYDLYYVEETSLWLNVVILLRTVQTVFFRSGS
jgi:exopolysaccharide biosynthesis polyprenyl glycosylphosphotransferase